MAGNSMKVSNNPPHMATTKTAFVSPAPLSSCHSSQASLYGLTKTNTSSFVAKRPLCMRSNLPNVNNKSKLIHNDRLSSSSRICAQQQLSDVLIVGANRGLGASLLSYLSTSKNVKNITSTHRPQTTCPDVQRSQSTTVLPLNALDRSKTYDAVQSIQPKIVISCIRDADDDLSASKNLIDASVEAACVKRFIYISALGAGESECAVPSQVMTTMRPILLDKTDAEAYLRAHSKTMPFTIVRPAPFLDNDDDNDNKDGEAIVTEEVKCYGTVTRSRLSVALCNIAESNAAEGRTLHVVDRRRVLITAPYVRPLEFWEALPFKEYVL